MKDSIDKKMSATENKRLSALDRKIERLQGKVSKVHSEYEVLIEELSDLLKERYPERQEEYIKDILYKAYQKSNKSLEMIVSFIVNNNVTLSECEDTFDF